MVQYKEGKHTVKNGATQQHALSSESICTTNDRHSIRSRNRDCDEDAHDNGRGRNGEDSRPDENLLTLGSRHDGAEDLRLRAFERQDAKLTLLFL